MLFAKSFLLMLSTKSFLFSAILQAIYCYVLFSERIFITTLAM